jgi:glycosyltransferase involved in cell wall biosynthesis
MVLDSNYPPTGGGGAEFQVRTLARYFQSRGIAVEIIVPMVRYGPQVADEHVDGVPVHRIRYPDLRLIGGAVMLVRLAARLFVRRHRYAAVHVHIAHRMAAVASVVGALLGKPVIVKLTGLQELEHGILAPGADDVMQRLTRWGVQRASWIQATSTRIRKALLARGFDGARVVAIPNAVDAERFRPSATGRASIRQALGVPVSRRVVVYSGRLEIEKGVHDLIAAWAQCAGDADAELWLIGSGSRLESLRSELVRFGVETSVRLLGAHDRTEQYLVGADASVLPSHNEGLSNSLLEAMACGLPVVGTRVSGTEDFVEPMVTGMLVEPRDVAGLATSLGRMLVLSPGDLARYGDNARARIESCASIDRVAALLIEHYGLGGLPAGRGAAVLRGGSEG